MDPINTTPVQAPVPQPAAIPTLAPLPLRVITILGIIGSIWGIASSLLVAGLRFEVTVEALAVGQWSAVAIFLPLLLYILYLITFLQMHKMRKRALKLLIVTTCVQVVVAILFSLTPLGFAFLGIGHVVATVLDLIILAYVWSLRHRMS
jgi:hypothetical protein